MLFSQALMAQLLYLPEGSDILQVKQSEYPPYNYELTICHDDFEEVPEGSVPLLADMTIKEHGTFLEVFIKLENKTLRYQINK
jgi:hypothetical protein